MQGSDASTAADGMDWGVVQDLVRSIQSKQSLSKDTLANTKKSLKSPSKSAVCSTLTTLDSIAANCGPPIRSQLADSRWMEMLLSVCCKNPTAAMPICQLFSNWACSYNHELLGSSANAAIQNLRQRSAIIPPPAPSAHHMVCLQSMPLPFIAKSWRHNIATTPDDCRQKWLNRAHPCSAFSEALTSPVSTCGPQQQQTPQVIHCIGASGNCASWLIFVLQGSNFLSCRVLRVSSGLQAFW